METAREKLQFLSTTKFNELPFEHIKPDKNNNWINLTENNWDDLIPIASKETKLGKNTTEHKAIFKLFSLGVVTARDEWVYDINRSNLNKKVRYFITNYNKQVKQLIGKVTKETLGDSLDYSIKWTRAVKSDLLKGKKYDFEETNIFESLYRPFVKRELYNSSELNEMRYQNHLLFPNRDVVDNIIISISGTSASKPFHCLVTNRVASFDLLEKTQCLPLYRYDKLGNRVENITDWSLKRFNEHYKDSKITKEAIFRYAYAVLHHPAYREKYVINLKREFPRIPFYDNFWQWETWGRQLLDLHLDYENGFWKAYHQA